MRQGVLFRVEPIERDICANRHRGSDMSILANERVDKSSDRELIYGYVREAGLYGHTLDELAVILCRDANRISGRLTELRKAGRIIASPDTRKTRTGSWAHVYVVAQ